MKRRNTAATLAVRSVLEEARTALSREDLQKNLGDNFDRATLYRILNRFHADGLVHRVVGDDGRQYFALCDECSTDEHQHDHFHFRCRVCQTVECLEQEIDVRLPGGYRAEGLNGLVVGVCGRCG